MRTRDFTFGLLLLIFGGLVLLETCLQATGQRVSKSNTRLEDPMFGISYDYSKVHYEPIPASVRHICPNFAQGTFWIFAHVQRKSGDYFVIMGVRPGQNGDSLGTALVIKDSECSVEDSLWMLSGNAPNGGYASEGGSDQLPGLGAPSICDSSGDCHYILRSAAEEGLLRDLVRDALTRGAKAWGETGEFKKETCKPSVQEASGSMPIVRDEVKSFCSALQ